MAAEGRRMGWLWVGIALVIGALIGVGATVAFTSQAPAPPEKTFTIVAYHWGFALYDETGKEIPKIEVPLGTKVSLLVIGAEALSHDIHGVFEDRTIEAWADNPDFGSKNATEIHDLIEAAEDLGLEDHSVMISGYDLDIPAKGDSASPSIVTFTADKAGTFDIQCNEFCGWGHENMVLPGGLVVS